MEFSFCGVEQIINEMIKLYKVMDAKQKSNEGKWMGEENSTPKGILKEHCKATILQKNQILIKNKKGKPHLGSDTLATT